MRSILEANICSLFSLPTLQVVDQNTHQSQSVPLITSVKIIACDSFFVACYISWHAENKACYLTELTSNQTTSPETLVGASFSQPDARTLNLWNGCLYPGKPCEKQRYVSTSRLFIAQEERNSNVICAKMMGLHRNKTGTDIYSRTGRWTSLASAPNFASLSLTNNGHLTFHVFLRESVCNWC